MRFAFLTGLSTFSKVNLFSQLNNLTDITLDPVYSSICGYTEGDLDTVFAPELDGVDRERVREWYNGYSWRGAEKVYNPYDVLLMLRRREFEAHWFVTGTPAFLVDTLFERRVSSVSLNETVSTGELLSAFDVHHIGTEALLFQNRLSDDHGRRRAGRPAAVSAGLSEPGGAAEPEPGPAAPPGAGRGAADGQQRSPADEPTLKEVLDAVEANRQEVQQSIDAIMRRLDEQREYMTEQFEDIAGMFKAARRDRSAIKSRLTKVERRVDALEGKRPPA